MKRIIIVISLTLCMLIGIQSVFAIGDIDIYVDDPITGCANCAINEDIEVYIDATYPDYSFTGLTVGQNITSWFNAPSGLTATIKELKQVDDTDTIVVNFVGTLLNEDSSTPITVTVPANTILVGENPYAEAISSEENEDIAYVISKPTLDYDDNYVIAGEVGVAITPVTLSVTITDSGVAQQEFHPSFLNYEFASINGLTFKVIDVSVDKTSIDIEVSGAPTSASTSALSLTIPASGTVNQWCDISIPVGKASFNIVDNTPTPTYVPEPVVFEIPKTGVN